MNRIKKEKCFVHANDRDISEYVFWHTDIRKPKHVDIYRCKMCKDQLEKDLDRERRIKEHNDKQREESCRRMWIRIDKKAGKRKKSMTDNLWDCVVEKELLKGEKNKNVIFPKDMLSLKRAAMKLSRLIKNKKEEAKKEKELNEEKLKKSRQPLVRCPKHGSLFILDVIKSGMSRINGEQQYKCRKCMRDMHKAHYENNKEEVLKKQSIYRANNPEKVKEIRNKSWRKSNDKNNKHENATK